MLDTVRKWRATISGSSHDFALAADYDHAIAQYGHGYLEQAREEFRKVLIKRALALGKSHPDTLAAKREFVIACCRLQQWDDPEAPNFSEPKTRNIQGQPVDDSANENNSSKMTLYDWAALKSCLHKIMIEFNSQLGAAHPETITTMLCFTHKQSADALEFLQTLVQKGIAELSKSSSLTTDKLGLERELEMFRLVV